MRTGAQQPMNQPHVPDDRSNGYEAIAADFARLREESAVGLGTVLHWAKSLRPGAEVLDLGCGSGMPIAVTLDREGFVVSGVDAAPSLVAAFRKRLPHAAIACEAVEHSPFFGRTFDAVLAVGLVFLLPEDAQGALIRKVASVLRPGGRFLFSAPAQACGWADVLTGRPSRSPGHQGYAAIFAAAGLEPVATCLDEGGNHYFEVARPVGCGRAI